MNILIPLFSPSTGTWGGLTRVIAIAEEALRRGNQIAFCASGELEANLRQRGYPVFTMPSATFLGLPKSISKLIEARSQRASIPVKPGKSIGSIWLVMMISGMANQKYLRRLVTAELNAIRDFGADMLFTDLDPGAFLSARISGLPLASNYASIAATGTNTLPARIMSAASASVLKAHGKPAQRMDEVVFAPEILKIIPSIPALDDTDPARTDVRYVGHLLGDIHPAKPDAFIPEPGIRYTFVYVGTGSISLDALRRVLPQVFPGNDGRVCLVGAQSIHQEEHLAGVRFMPYVPATAVLPHCDWTICHGGQNTIIQSLLNGVPLLIFPGPIFERRYNAHKVQNAGAGWMGELNQFTEQELQQAFSHQAEYAAQARFLGNQLSALGGAHAAMDAVEIWLKNRQ